MKSRRIFLSPPHMGGEEQEFVRQAFESNYIAPLGEHVDGFEQDLCRVTGAAHAAVLSSGTAAIHLALVILGVGPGDEVMCQDLTFAASVNPVLYQGAVPVLIDSEPSTWNMDPELLRRAVQDSLNRGLRPKAVIAVHLYGMPARMHEIMAVSKEFDIPVVEDAAEALGSRLNGRPCGSLGHLGVLSFNGNKIITTSGGGALLSDDRGVIEKARFLASQARDPAPHYEHSQLGYNYRMSNILAAVGRGQARILAERVQARRKIYQSYLELLGDTPGIYFLPEPDGYFSNRWLTAVVVEPGETRGISREDIRLIFDKKNIEARPVWKPMHMQPLFQGFRFYESGVSRRIFEKGLCLPSGSNMSEEDIQRVACGFHLAGLNNEKKY